MTDQNCRIVSAAVNAAAEKAAASGAVSAGTLQEELENIFAENGFRDRKASSERILVIKDDGAGDFVLFSPVLKAIRETRKDAHITLLCSGSSSALSVYCPYVDEIIVNNTGYIRTDAIRNFRLSVYYSGLLLREEYDTVICGKPEGRSSSVLMAYLSGARERIAFSQNRADPENGRLVSCGYDVLLTQAVPFPGEPMPDAERYRCFAEAITGKELPAYEPEVWYSEQEEKEVENALKSIALCRRLCAVSPASSHGSNKLPAKCYAAAVKKIAREEPDTGFMILGAQKDRQEGEIIAEAAGERAVNLCGELSFLASAAALSRASVYIGNDTGLMHIAAAQHVPVLEASCYPSDLHFTYASSPVRFAPYHVPSVTVLPDQALDGCAGASYEGCERRDEVHCIAQIRPETLLAGYRLLKKQSRLSCPHLYMNSRGILDR